MDFLDEQKVKSVIIDPMIDRLKAEIIPTLDKVLADRIDQIHNLITMSIEDIKTTLNNTKITLGTGDSK